MEQVTTEQVIAAISVMTQEDARQVNTVAVQRIKDIRNMDNVKNSTVLQIGDSVKLNPTAVSSNDKLLDKIEKVTRKARTKATVSFEKLGSWNIPFGMLQKV